MEHTQLAADVERLAEGSGQLPEPVFEPVFVIAGGLACAGQSYFCGELTERLLFLIWKFAFYTGSYSHCQATARKRAGTFFRLHAFSSRD